MIKFAKTQTLSVLARVHRPLSFEPLVDVVKPVLALCVQGIQLRLLLGSQRHQATDVILTWALTVIVPLQALIFLLELCFSL